MDIRDRNAFNLWLSILNEFELFKMVDNLKTWHHFESVFLENKNLHYYNKNEMYIENWLLKHVYKIILKCYDEIFN